jgi:hypothetical protein
MRHCVQWQNILPAKAYRRLPEAGAVAFPWYQLALRLRQHNLWCTGGVHFTRVEHSFNLACNHQKHWSTGSPSCGSFNLKASQDLESSLRSLSQAEGCQGQLRWDCAIMLYNAPTGCVTTGADSSCKVWQVSSSAGSASIRPMMAGAVTAGKGGKPS